MITSVALKTIKSETFAFLESAFLNLRLASGAQISIRTANENASQLTIELFDTLIRQLDPLRDAYNRLFMRIAEEYGNRVVAVSVKNDVLKKLANEYLSQDFIIDYREASDLFQIVRKPTVAEIELARQIHKLIGD